MSAPLTLSTFPMNQAPFSLRQRFPRMQYAGRRALIAACITVVLAGCNRPQLDPASAVEAGDVSRRYPVVVQSDRAIVHIPNRPPDADSARLELEVERYLAGFRRDGEGPVHIWLPTQSAALTRSSPGLALVYRAARKTGVHARLLKEHVTAEGNQQITLSYNRTMTVSPDCGNWRDNAGRNDENIPYDNFGCASQRNLAAMIARPSDAVYATPEVPRQGDKKSTDYTGFIKPVPVNPTSQSGVR